MDKKIVMILGIVIAILLVAVIGLGALLMQGNSTTNMTNNTTNISDNTNVKSNSNNDTDVNAQKEVCKECNGVGYYVCNVCGGTGKDPNDPDKPCPGGQYDCVGGKNYCYPCGGNGYIDDGDPGYMK